MTRKKVDQWPSNDHWPQQLLTFEPLITQKKYTPFSFWHTHKPWDGRRFQPSSSKNKKVMSKKRNRHTRELSLEGHDQVSLEPVVTQKKYTPFSFWHTHKPWGGRRFQPSNSFGWEVMSKKRKNHIRPDPHEISHNFWREKSYSKSKKN